jgi:hypothetical protein
MLQQILDEEKSKHASLAQQSGFDLSITHDAEAGKRQSKP